MVGDRGQPAETGTAPAVPDAPAVAGSAPDDASPVAGTAPVLALFRRLPFEEQDPVP